MNDDEPIEEFTSLSLTAAASVARASETFIRHAQELKARGAADSRARADELDDQVRTVGEVADQWLKSTDREDWMTRSTPAEVSGAVRASHEWAQLDADRFAPHAERLREQYRAAFGLDLREAAQDAANSANLDELQRIAHAGVIEHRHPDPLGIDQVDAKELVDVDQLASKQSAAELPYDSAERRSTTAAAMREAEVPEGAIKAREVADQLNAHDPTTAAAAAGGPRAPAPARPARAAGRGTGTNERVR